MNFGDRRGVIQTPFTFPAMVNARNVTRLVSGMNGTLEPRMARSTGAQGWTDRAGDLLGVPRLTCVCEGTFKSNAGKMAKNTSGSYLFYPGR